MSEPKEPRLFVAGAYPESLADAASLFVPGAAVRGESTAVYSQFPGWPGVPERIAREVPAARIVYVVRDPVERALAHYRQHVRDGKEPRSVEEAMSGPGHADHTYVSPSRYATQVRRYLAHFEREQVLIIDQQALRSEREATLASVFAHAGVDAGFRSPGFAQELNTREHLRRPTGLGTLARGSGAVALGRRLPGASRLRSWTRGARSRAVPEPELPAAVHSALVAELSSEAAAIREISGLTLGHWSL